jgi:hypothetical protein
MKGNDDVTGAFLKLSKIFISDSDILEQQINDGFLGRTILIFPFLKNRGECY